MVGPLKIIVLPFRLTSRERGGEQAHHYNEAARRGTDCSEFAATVTAFSCPLTYAG